MPIPDERIEFAAYNGHRIATVIHDAGGQSLVLFCHGFKGTKAGPSRLFVRAARQLADSGVSSIRFDQFGSGDSDGDFIDSSFNDWIATTAAIVEHYGSLGMRVALWGQSMGASAAIVVASNSATVEALVAWVPDPNIDPYVPSSDGFTEEDGQRVRDAYWREARAAKVADRLAEVRCPSHVVIAGDDAFVDEANRQALIARAQPHHRLEVLSKLPHSAWPFDDAVRITDASVDFLTNSFESALSASPIPTYNVPILARNAGENEAGA